MDQSNLLSLWAEFLQRPVIEVRTAPAEELKTLREEVARLQIENARLTRLYGDELTINMRLQDRLKEYGL